MYTCISMKAILAFINGLIILSLLSMNIIWYNNLPKVCDDYQCYVLRNQYYVKLIYSDLLIIASLTVWLGYCLKNTSQTYGNKIYIPLV